MKSAVIVDCVRTPIGRAHPERGVFRRVRSDDLAVACIEALLQRQSLPPEEIEDVILGCAQPTGEQGLNAARMIGLMARLPMAAGGTTVNRLCGSGLQALHQATHAILAGAEDVQIVGGFEHMLRVPIEPQPDVNPKLFRHTSRAALQMGLTAEFLAQSQAISRQDQDAFAYQSHQRAALAQREGHFQREVIAVFGHDDQGNRVRVSQDQCVRSDTSLEALASLEPVFLPKLGTVTAGNSSPRNDGAAAMLVMSEERSRALGLQPLVRVRATAVAGVPPCLMGTGPVPATQKALRRAGLTLDQIGLIEINEAFAAQALACIRLLGLNEERVNVRGGAIAIGHPLGASGARVATTLIRAMIDLDIQFGLATMCIGIGQGIATVFERV